MGCSTSKAVEENAAPVLRVRTGSEERNAPLTSEEISERIESPEAIRRFQVNDSLAISYAWYDHLLYFLLAYSLIHSLAHSLGCLNGDTIQMPSIKRIKIHTV